MIYQLVIAKNTAFSNHAIANAPEDIKKGWEKVTSKETNTKYGKEWVLFCDCSWANEEYRHWAIGTYADVKACIEHTREIAKAKWFEYADMTSLLGTDYTGNGPQMPEFSDPIYQLWILRNNPVTIQNYLDLSKEQETEMWEAWAESVKRTGGLTVLRCKSYWASEQTYMFGINAFPSIEARIAHADDIEKLNWPLYFDVFSLLGTLPEKG